MEACAHLQEAPHGAAHHNLALGRIGDLGEDLEEGALARPVAADDAYAFPSFHGVIDVPQRPEHLLGLPHMLCGSERMADHGRQPLSQASTSVVVALAGGDDVLLGQVPDLDGRLHQITSARRLSYALKYRSPTKKRPV